VTLKSAKVVEILDTGQYKVSSEFIHIDDKMFSVSKGKHDQVNFLNIFSTIVWLNAYHQEK